MNDIQMFYLNDSSNGKPTYEQVMAADFHWLEQSHDWCQRAFPNFEPSEVVSDAPVLDDITFYYLKDYHLQQRIYSLTFKYIVHYVNLEHHTMLQHNNRRVTRLIKFLTMLGYEDAAKTVFATCVGLLYEWNQIADLSFDLDTTVMYWTEALKYKREEK